MYFKYTVMAASVASILSIAGCNSESGGSVDAVGGVIITTIDGYLKNALICSDTNQNGICDAGEVITDKDGNPALTNNMGMIDIKVDKSVEETIRQSPIVVKVLQPFEDNSAFNVEPGIYTIDMDQPYQAMAKEVVFRAPAGTAVVTPLTDLIVVEMNKGHDLATAENNVQSMLEDLKGDDEDLNIDLYDDYIASKESDTGSDAEIQLATKLHKVAQILTETHNQSDSAAIEEVTSQILEEVVKVVESASDQELTDPNYKPYVPVTGSGDDIIVEEPIVNHQAVADANRLTAIHNEIKEAELEAGSRFAFFGKQTLDGLFTDEDQDTNPQVSISADSLKALSDKGIKAEVTHSVLSLTSIESVPVTAGTYYIEFVADDENSNGDVIGTVSTLIDFDVIAFSTAPEVDVERLAALQAEFDNLPLTNGAMVEEQTFDFTDLFSDEDGDELSYTFSDNGTGLQYQTDGTTLTVSGTPNVSGNWDLTITATDGESSVNAIIDLTIVEAPVTDNPLPDLLVDKHLYRFTTEPVDGTLSAECWAIKLTSDFQVLEANSGSASCPSEIDFDNEPVGQWDISGQDDVIMTLDGNAPIKLSLIEDSSTETRMPRIHLSAATEQVTLTRAAAKSASANSPVTFYVGQESADDYWNQSAFGLHSFAVVNAQTTQIFALTETERDIGSMLSFSTLAFTSTCENLGYAKDGDSWLDYDTYSWTTNAIYDIHYLNAKFEGGMQTLAREGKIAMLFPANDPLNVLGVDSCVIISDDETNANILPGEAVTIVAEPRITGAGSEEFIINTYVDRNFTITPQASLEIDETGIFVVDIDSSANEGGYIHLYKNQDGTISEVDYWYSMSDGEGRWGEGYELESIFTPYQVDGNQLYQFWAAGDSGEADESFTVWSDNNSGSHGTVRYIEPGGDAGIIDTCDEFGESHCIYEAQFVTNQEEARTLVESTLNTSLNFIDTDWEEEHLSDGEIFNVSYREIGVTYDGEFYPWEQMPKDLPCLVESGHTCTVAQLNNTYKFCDAEEPNVAWDDCIDSEKYYVTWRYTPLSDDALYRAKRPETGSHTSYSTMTPIH